MPGWGTRGCLPLLPPGDRRRGRDCLTQHHAIPSPTGSQAAGGRQAGRGSSRPAAPRPCSCPRLPEHLPPLPGRCSPLSHGSTGIRERMSLLQGAWPSSAAAELLKCYRMILTWTLVLVLALLARPGEAQSCKPQLEGILRNLARGRPAYQSSTYANSHNPVAGKAVDGRCLGNFNQDSSCTHTNLDDGPWWFVDLGEQYDISAVVVQNRGDCCGERLKGAEIRVGNSAANNGRSNCLCGTITDTSLGAISTISCNGRKGRYVSISIPGRSEYLTLCEVEVYGTKCP